MNQRYIFVAVAVIFTCIYLDFDLKKEPSDILYVYNWSKVFPKKLLEKFEAETGIKVVYDIYDSNEILEAKLFVGFSGYDVVFPSTFPFAKRQVKAGVYHQIDKSKIPNLSKIDPLYFTKIKSADPYGNHLIPFLWGTNCVIYNYNKIQSIISDKADLQKIKDNPLELLFNKEYTTKLAPHGISLMSEAPDLVALVLTYLGYDINAGKSANISKAFTKLYEIHPFVSQFQNYKATDDLLYGNIVVAQTWSCQANVAMARDKNKTLIYQCPKQGQICAWLDCAAIVKGAPHLENAHKFINFLLHPENMALISKASYSYNTLYPKFQSGNNKAMKCLIPSSDIVKRSTLHYSMDTPAINRLITGNMRKLLLLSTSNKQNKTN